MADWVSSACLPRNQCYWEGKKNVRHAGKTGEGKECQHGARTSLFLAEILSKGYSFPKQTNQSNSPARTLHSLIFPSSIEYFLMG